MLPSKLLYQNKIESSYARNFISKIQPQNTSNFGLGQTTIINIPCMNNQVLSGVDTVLNVSLVLRNGAVDLICLSMVQDWMVLELYLLFKELEFFMDLNYSQILIHMET